MILIPSIDLMGGHVVSLIQGQPGTQQVTLPDAAAVFQKWVRAGAPWIHVVDLDAALDRGSNAELIRRELHRKTPRVQVGGGVRDEERIRHWLEAGAERVVVGTRGILDPVWLERMADQFPNRIVLALDAREGRIVTRGWTRSTGIDFVRFARDLRGAPLAGLLYTAVHVEGKLEGVDRPGIERLVKAVPLPVMAAGGITTLDDLRFLKKAGVHAAVVGLALYNGRLDYEEARRVAEEEK